MARRGRFGRRPRSSPDLTATILAMAREYQNKKDSNVLNSWDKGGKFEGKQVTDEYLMSYLKSRRDGLAKDDPLYDEMSQKVDEYSFAIANSRQELKYAEHKVTDGAMSAFYQKWAAKLPQHSEAWRNMMTLSAQYKDRAAKGSGGGGRGKKSGYDSDANRIPLKKELAYDTIMSTLTDIARATGILNTERESLQDLRVAENDASRFTELLNTLNNDPNFAADKANLTAYIKKYGNENFNGQFTWDTIQKEKVNKQNGIGHRIRLAQKAGHATDVKKLTEEQTKFGAEFVAVTAAGALAEYEQARHDFDTETDNPNATPLDAYLSMTKYRDKLEGISAKTAALPSDDKGAQTLNGHLNNEIQSLYGNDTKGPSLWEDSRGVVAAYKPEGGETTANAEDFKLLEKQVTDLATGKGVVVRVDGRGQPTDDPAAEFGVVLASAIGKGVAYVPATGQAPPSITLSDGTVLSTKPIMTAIMPTPIYTQGSSGEPDFAGRPSVTGRPTQNTNVANLFVMPDGTQLAQYWDQSKPPRVRWTNDVDGLLKGAKTEDTPDGVRVTVPYTARSGKNDYDPYLALDPAFTATPDAMPNSVGLSSYSVWLSSNRTATSDPGMAYAQDPQVTALAITREVGTDDPLALGAAMRDAEEARTDYLTNTPDIARRLRAAAQQNRAAPIADKAGIEGFADFDALGKDVSDFYRRLTDRAHEDTTGDMEGRRGRMGWQTDEFSERDAQVRAALMQDPTEAARIMAIEDGKNPYQLPAHIMDLSAGQTKQVVGPSNAAPATGQAGVVAGFKDVANSALKDAASALNRTFVGGPTSLGGSIVPPAVPNSLGAPQTPAPPKPKPTPYIPPPSTATPPPPPPRLTIRPGLTGTHPGGGGPQEYN